jgi:anthranilate/para-aminobenzoate synthase component I
MPGLFLRFASFPYNPRVQLPRINLSSPPDGAADNPWPTGFLLPVSTLRCDGRTHISTASVGASVIRQWDNPLDALTWMSQTFWRDRGRWIGFLAYDLGRLFERLPEKQDDLNLPLFSFTYCRPVPARSYAPEPHHPTNNTPLLSNFSRADYKLAVNKAIDYIRAGDVFQVNLSQRFTVGIPAHPAAIYSALLQQSPARYGAYFNYEDFALISNSPELFLRITPERKIITRPIKGTRPRAAGMETELRDSSKDQAELNMIVDLERNDLGRICRTGSVKVTQPRTIEAHPTVYHGVAAIEGTLRDEIAFVDILRATFPGGSVTGAPKIRAMEIVDELETVNRGPYCGAIGYLAADGAIEFSVAIRTMIIKDGLAHIFVGGGIVADSDPAQEYEETLVKARAMFAALGIEGPSAL